MTEAEFFEMIKAQMEVLNQNLERCFAFLLALSVGFALLLVILLAGFLHGERKAQKGGEQQRGRQSDEKADDKEREE